MFKSLLRKLTTALVLCIFLVYPASTLQAQKLQVDADEIHYSAQIPATPDDGLAAYQQYIAKNLTYPTISLRNKVEGKVVVEFVIEKDGTVSDLKVTEGLDEACNKESIRVIADGPKWKPAINRGEKIRQRVIMPIHFSIPSSDKTDTTAVTSSETELDEKARPHEGLDQFYARLQQQQHYPRKAQKNKTEGKVMVSFIVEESGKLTDIEVVQGLGNGLDKEALRLIKKSPNWMPARHKGKPIRQKIILPVIFRL